MTASQRQWLWWTLGWLAWCSYRFCLPFWAGEGSIAQAGPGWDGYGTFSWIHAFLHPMPGASNPLLGDLYQDIRIGMGHHAQPLISPFWRWWWSLLGLLSQDGNTLYTLNILALTLANALACMWLGQQLGLAPLWNTISTVLVLGLEHFDLRAREHIGLIVIFPSLMLAGLLWRLPQTKAKRDWLGVALWGTIGFWSSEYNTFFGGLWAGLLGLFALGRQLWRQPTSWLRSCWQWGLGAAAAVVGTVAILLLSYPNFLAKPLLYRLGWAKQAPQHHLAWDRPRTDFEFYAINNLQGLIAPHLPWLRSHAPKWLLEDPWRAGQVAKETYEFTFGIGLLLPVLLLASGLWLARQLASKRALASNSGNQVTTAAMVLLASCALLPLAMPSNWFGSLVPVIAASFPMMRVVQRSLLWWSIGMVLALALVLHTAWQVFAQRPKPAWQTYLAGAVLAFALLLGHADGRSKERPSWYPLATRPLPWSAQLTEQLQRLPAGKLLHLPICNPKQDYLSCDYRAMAITAYHGHGLFNGFDPVQHIHAAIFLQSYWQQPQAVGLALMQALGIDYVVLDPRADAQTLAWRQSLQPVGDGIYQVPNTAKLTLHELAAAFSQPFTYPAVLLGPALQSPHELLRLAGEAPGFARSVRHDGPATLLQHPMLQLRAGKYQVQLHGSLDLPPAAPPVLLLQVRSLRQQNQWMELPLRFQQGKNGTDFVAEAVWQLPVPLMVSLEIASKQAFAGALQQLVVKPAS